MSPRRRSAGAGSADRGGALDALVTRARSGDRAAFADLVRLNRGEVQRVALRLVGNHEDADDVAQETFVRAWSGLPLFRGDVRFGAWLLGITVHLARDHHRRRGRSPETEAAALLEAAGDQASRGPGEIGARREQMRLVEAAIAALPERLRTALVLRTLEGQGYDEIGRVTGVRPATVRTRLVEARRALRRLLGRHLEDGRDGDEGGRTR
ncbi:MAG: RNA polymerase sigma factor [Planctomycetota bacterium]